MAIGKYCQLCGAKKKRWDVIAEVRGVTVTSDCLMDQVFAPKHAGRVDLDPGLIRFCQHCGGEQAKMQDGYCGSCGKPLTPGAAAAKLDAAGKPARLLTRVWAFMLDLLIIATLSALVYLLWKSLSAGLEWTIHPDFKSIGTTFGLVFITYHTLFTWSLGRSPGKMALGTRIVMKDGNTKLSLPRSLVRSLLYPFTIYVLPIGLIPLVTNEPRASWLKIIFQDALLHDPLTDTTVVRMNKI